MMLIFICCNLSRKTKPIFVNLVKEYRDIPPYKDAPNDDETGTINSNRRRNDDFVDYQSGSRFDGMLTIFS